MSAQLEGANIQRGTLTVPARGVWVAELLTDAPPPAEGALATLTMLGVPYVGTVSHRGEYAGQGGCRLIGGRGGWGSVLPPRHYHSDGGVQARSVVADIAREAGEVLAEQASGSLGSDWTRATAPASSCLDAALSGGPWYVGSDGRTYLSERPSGAMGGNVLDWDPVAALVVLGLETDASRIAPGLAITDDRLPGPLTAREVRFELGGSTVRAVAWCPAESSGRGRLATALASVVAHAAPPKLLGKFHYRVFRMSGDRVEAQAVSRADGLPDIVPVEQWPGVPGTACQLAMGSDIAVEFLAGDPSRPIVTAYGPRSSAGFVPESVGLCDGVRPVARVGDSVTVFLASGAPVFIAGTLNGVPIVGGALTFTTPLMGVIGSGSAKVKA